MVSALKPISMPSPSGNVLRCIFAPCNRMNKILILLAILFTPIIYYTVLCNHKPRNALPLDHTIRPIDTISSADLHRNDAKLDLNQMEDDISDKKPLRKQSEKASKPEIDREKRFKLIPNLDPNDSRVNGLAGGISLMLETVAPYLFGYIFGFLGSIPIAGPTSAMVFRLGIQGKYRSGLAIASGGAIAEAVYAGIAFWGFGSFLDGASFLLPISKVFGAFAFSGMGIYFIRLDFKPPNEPELRDSQHKKLQRARDEVLKSVLMGFTISGINPALLATYTAAIASIYSTGMLTFNFRLAVVFSVGVSCGIFSWFYVLLALLKKYKKRLKNKTIGIFMRGMGYFLLVMGFLCAKSAIEYFIVGF